MPELLTPLEASKELGLSRRMVNHLLNTGKLKGQKVGPNWVIIREDLEAYKADRETAAKK